ncbi:MAG TPA: ferritin [Longimicrobiales bacterium]|nr:ferritin [Longimicrobiales bacterium]
MDDEVRGAIHNQINQELRAAYLYLAMAAHFEVQSLDGFGTWMRLQAREEVGHAMRLFDFVVRRGGEVRLLDLPAPDAKLGSPLEVFKLALEHEIKVTALINELYELAAAKRDYPTRLELQWFIEEQVEEEATAGKIVEQLEMVGDDRAALLTLDQKLGGRAAAK